MDLLLEGLVLAGLFFVLGEEEADFLVQGAEVGFCFVVLRTVSGSA